MKATDVCVDGPVVHGATVTLCITCRWPWQKRRARRRLTAELLPRMERLMNLEGDGT